MPEGKVTHLRIHCLCGQKMKMSEDMFGRPGKCVACRQKIRIPRPDEIPAEVTDIHLKDYPQFLRKSRSKRSKPAAPALKAAVPTPVPDADKPTLVPGIKPEKRPRPPKRRKPKASRAAEVKTQPEAALKRSVPLDILDALRNLCSLRYKIQQRMQAFEEDPEASALSRAELEKHLARVRGARQQLNEQLLQISTEVSIELESTEEKIVQAQLGARVGDTSFDRYVETIERLRRRRYRLERRQHNLGGWLTTRDPYVAGGYIDLPFESIPAEGFTITISTEPDEAGSRLEICAAGLREAFDKRGHAERTLAELERMERSTSRGNAKLDEARLEARAQRRVANAAMAFWRAQFEQLRRDYEGDNDTIAAQLDLARGKLGGGEILNSEFEVRESALLRTRSDGARAASLIEQALNANSPQDVPHPRSTLLDRLAVDRAGGRRALDAQVGGVAALLLWLAIFVPSSVGDQSMVSAFGEFSNVSGVMRWLLLGPAVAGTLAGLAVLLRDPAYRGRALLLLGVLSVLAGLFFIHNTHFGFDPISGRMRVGSWWLLRPGMFLTAVSCSAILAAGAMALAPVEGERWWVIAAAVGVVLGGLAVQTDMGTLVLPRPAVSADPNARTITVSNDGLRPLYLVAKAVDVRGAYLYSLEQKIGRNSWKPIEETGAVPGLSETEPYRIDSKDAWVSYPSLAPGTSYRVQLTPSSGADPAVELTFDIPGPAGLETEAAADDAASAAAPSRSARERVVLEPPAPLPAPEVAPIEAAPEVPERASPFREAEAVEVELRGILAADPTDPKFSFALHFADGSQRRITLSKGEALHGPWLVKEYNEIDRRVILTDGEHLRPIILRTGERVSLPAP